MVNFLKIQGTCDRLFSFIKYFSKNGENSPQKNHCPALIKKSPIVVFYWVQWPFSQQKLGVVLQCPFMHLFGHSEVCSFAYWNYLVNHMS
jgi:hypothetical protein